MLDDIFIGEHTQYCESMIYNMEEIFDGINDEESYVTFYEKINDVKLNRTFGESLLNFMQRKNPKITLDIAAGYLLECCKNHGIEKDGITSERSIKKWFNSAQCPSHSKDGRKTIYAISFGLELTLDETIELFHKVYLDRAFDLRVPEEIIYYYCIRDGRSWDDAKRLIEVVCSDKIKKADKETVRTHNIKADIDMITDDDVLVRYVNSHGRNFAEKMVTAFELRDRLAKEARKYAEAETNLCEWRKKRKNRDREYEGVKELDAFIVFRGMDIKSNNFLYFAITGQRPIGLNGTEDSVSKMILPKRLRVGFPKVGKFLGKNLNYRSLRQVLILLGFYTYWSKIRCDEDIKGINGSDYFDMFIEYMNEILDDSGFPRLYQGDTYDWFFLYCSYTDDPISALRRILVEAYNQTDECY